MNETGMWVVFAAVVIIMLFLDLGVFHRKAHAVPFKEALIWSIVWIALSLAFNLWVYWWKGSKAGLEFLTGYLIEKSLSVDNIFVFLVIFNYFHVPAAYQHRVLFWGILGALVFRAVFIATGIQLLQMFHWMLYVFGGFLILTGIKMAVQHDKKIQVERNPVVRVARRLFRVTEGYRDAHFFVRQQGYLYATPLFVVLLFVEFTDIMFAIDSIPAILAVSRDPFIVYTSNVFAILGLRALYFCLAGFANLFAYLHYGLAAILVFVGAKMMLSEVYKVPVAASLGFIALVLVVSVVASVVKPPKGTHAVLAE
ncbi:MAG: TerC family protein [Armatimonadota bacterium]|nr:TerC family protein [bacterium]MDW8319918.1 TerC family protein [Armatimonadota bacterium]